MHNTTQLPKQAFIALQSPKAPFFLCRKVVLGQKDQKGHSPTRATFGEPTFLIYFFMKRGGPFIWEKIVDLARRVTNQAESPSFDHVNTLARLAMSTLLRQDNGDLKIYDGDVNQNVTSKYNFALV